MHTGALKALGFDQVVEAVTSFALTPLGAETLARLHPLTEARSIRTALAHTTEGVRFLEANGRFPLEAPDDLNTILAALAIEAQVLQPAQLLKLTAFLRSVERVCQSVATATGVRFRRSPRSWTGARHGVASAVTCVRRSTTQVRSLTTPARC